jgi:hypothetical protein
LHLRPLPAGLWRARRRPIGLTPGGSNSWRLKKVQMRGGAPLFELSDGLCRRETRAGLIPHARRSLSTLRLRPRAPTKQMGLFQPPG